MLAKQLSFTLSHLLPTFMFKCIYPVWCYPVSTSSILRRHFYEMPFPLCLRPVISSQKEPLAVQKCMRCLFNQIEQSVDNKWWNSSQESCFQLHRCSFNNKMKVTNELAFLSKYNAILRKIYWIILILIYGRLADLPLAAPCCHLTFAQEMSM